MSCPSYPSAASRRTSIFVLVLCGLLTLHESRAQTQRPEPTLPAKGLVVWVDSPSGSDASASAAEFATMEAYGQVKAITFTNGRVLKTTAAKHVFHYPDFTRLTITSEADWQKLQEYAVQAQALGQKYPKAAPALSPFIKTIQGATDRGKTGMVVVAGRWMSTADYEKAQKAVSRTYVLALSVGGSTYRNARLHSIQDGQVKIVHDGGFATFPLASLTTAQKAELSNTNTEVLGLR